ncbi:MAG: T9SS type A sorting domain-containing protein [Saprospiraceae bacterium]|nr:T9SS type A sorting domain-containing protein [Saprospiraceae bacterium]
MKNLILCFILCLSNQILFCQEIKPRSDRSTMQVAASFNGIQTTQCLGLINPPSLDIRFLPSLMKLRKEYNRDDNEEIKKIKELNYKLKKLSLQKDSPNAENSSLLAKEPVVGLGLKANQNTGSTPMDNTIAISNTGWIVSAANNSIYYVRNGAIQYSQNFSTFLNNNFESTCDPVVIWDPEYAKFFMYIQDCGSSKPNKVILLFSVSSNPNDGWWYYSFNGDPNGGFFDYPKVGQSTENLFVSGNVYVNDKYDHSNLIQIDKASGYSSQTLQYTIWNRINSDYQFTLLPLSYGLNGTYGPGIYLVSTEVSGGNYFGFYDLTDDLGNNPQLLYEKVACPTYGPGSDADQLGSTCPLDVSACRTQSGYYMNNRVHFVCNSVSPDKWSALGYFVYNIQTKKSQYDYFGSTGWDYAYPSIAFYGKTKTDNESMIFFQRSNENNYPQSRVVYVNGTLDFSGSVYVYSLWEAECEKFGTDYNRWGDYTGITRNYSSTSPSVWVAGAYGDFDGYWNAYIAEVHDNGQSVVHDINSNKDKISLSPNPSSDRFSVKFNLNSSGKTKFQVYSESGKLAYTLMDEYVSMGEHIFAFETKILSPGNYILQIIQNSKIIAHEKFIVNH